ncbi:S41 family peptidase [Lutibacter sp.]|uniref:S41 family peptidase n=1 Tax=Lutibacter sp. TaxID=1925666 RepID=UPI002735DF77|nr:S41 family peptidase [Lutibacter sp.]MDP3313245.1 S41 family peptidase [Lutibacter sp.]
MKKISYYSIISIILLSLVFACNKNDDEIRPDNNGSLDFSKVEIQDFIWEGMNFYYLWKDNVPNLNNTKDKDNASYYKLLSFYSDPDDFFESLIYDRQNTDKWSWIVDDYVALENSFQGISTSNGVKYRLAYETGSSTKILGYVRYILPNSNAVGKDVKRGYVFNAINGTPMTADNYQALLALDTYTMNFADLNGGNPISNGKSVTLTKSEYQENPVYITKTFNIGGKKIGYIMYNSFTSSYDQQLNTAFGQLKADGVTELILDLRYNGGGSVTTATYLAGMITGQFNGQLFLKEKWNNELQQWFEKNQPTWLVDNFTNEIVKTENGSTVRIPINSLNLTKLYVITTSSSASASELIINGLNPYINVITVGTKTSGKYTASVTLYDSDNFSKTGANLNPRHKWALQPIVLETVNKIGANDKDGFDPTVEKIEYVAEFQELGLETEPLLARAIAHITTGSKSSSSNVGLKLNELTDVKGVSKTENRMYVDKKFPDNFLKKE